VDARIPFFRHPPGKRHSDKFIVRFSYYPSLNKPGPRFCFGGIRTKSGRRLIHFSRPDLRMAGKESSVDR
jgi:hypothetical protein